MPAAHPPRHSSAPRPAIGRIVHYNPPAAEPGELPDPCAAMIFGVDEAWNSDTPISSPSHVHLRAIGFEGVPMVIYDVPLGVGTRPTPGYVLGSWRWPERV